MQKCDVCGCINTDEEKQCSECGYVFGSDTIEYYKKINPENIRIAMLSEKRFKWIFILLAIIHIIPLFFTIKSILSLIIILTSLFGFLNNNGPYEYNYKAALLKNRKHKRNCSILTISILMILYDFDLIALNLTTLAHSH